VTNLLWPGDQRAGELMTDRAIWSALVRVESCWLAALSQHQLIPPDAACDLSGLLGDDDREWVSNAADDTGNPVVGLVSLLRRHAPEAARPWIHRGLTSQDAVDTAMMLASRDVIDTLRHAMADQITSLTSLVDLHRHTPMVARTLTQHAIPTTFGVKAAGWLTSLCDGAERLPAVQTPVQIGGAAGTLAACTELATLRNAPGDPVDTATQLVATMAGLLGLSARTAWHTARAPITAIGDAFVGCTDAWGRIGSDVVTLARPEIGEVRESGDPSRGGSSTMPDKHNPVLSILVRRAALAAPPMAATLHTAAALSNDERPDAAWHTEWDTLRILARRTLIAASHATDLLRGLHVETARMADNLAAARVGGEQRSIAALAGEAPSADYFGASSVIIDDAIARARALLEDLP
jgi:3-carboxy-cis,cis-muconate cycloisomerase